MGYLGDSPRSRSGREAEGRAALRVLEEVGHDADTDEQVLIARLFVISGPSGVGKTSIVRPLLRMRPDLELSISCTTRPPRPGEVDGRDYRFVSPLRFEQLVEDGAFLEWAEVFGHRYGTLLAPIADALEAARDVLLEIDVQGARSVRERFPDAVLIFVVPPSPSNFLQQLEERLRNRGSESENEIARRLAAAREEMEAAHRFDHVVVNDRIDRAAAEVAAIIEQHGGKPIRSSP